MIFYQIYLDPRVDQRPFLKWNTRYPGQNHELKDVYLGCQYYYGEPSYRYEVMDDPVKHPEYGRLAGVYHQRWVDDNNLNGLMSKTYPDHGFGKMNPAGTSTEDLFNSWKNASLLPEIKRI